MQPNSDGKASPGSPFKPPAARIWNNMVDAGRAHADSLLNGGAPNPIRPRETDIIKVKNNSGAIRRTGEILRISGKALGTVTAENPWLLGVEPTDDGFFGILKEPASISGFASLQVSGCCMALVNVTDVDHKRAMAVDGEYVLQSGNFGPIELLYAPSGTGEKTCVVRFSDKSSNRPAVIGSALTAPASSLAVATSCTIYFLELQSDGTQELNTTAETAHNDDPEITADVGTYCRVEWLNGRWMIYYLGCDIQSALVAVVPEA